MDYERSHGGDHCPDMVLGLAGAASAGEYAGRGEPVPGGVNGASECSYSGQDLSDDLENNPPGFDDDDIFFRAVFRTTVSS